MVASRSLPLLDIWFWAVGVFTAASYGQDRGVHSAAPKQSKCPSQRRGMFTKSAPRRRSLARSWAGSEDEGAGETKELGAALRWGLVPDNPRADRRGFSSSNLNSIGCLHT